MHIILVQYELHLPGSHSLKDKRHVIKPVLNAIRRDFNVSASEVDDHDHWQQAVIAIVAVGGLKPALERIERSVTEWLENQGEIQVSAVNLQWL